MMNAMEMRRVLADYWDAGVRLCQGKASEPVASPVAKPPRNEFFLAESKVGINVFAQGVVPAEQGRILALLESFNAKCEALPLHLQQNLRPKYLSVTSSGFYLGPAETYGLGSIYCSSFKLLENAVNRMQVMSSAVSPKVPVGTLHA